MKMQENKLKKFNVYKIIANVLFILTVVFGSLFLIGSIIGAVVLSATGYEVLDIVKAILREVQPNALELIPNDFVIPYGMIITGIISAGFSFALTAYIFKAVSRMFGTIVKQETPFTEGVVRGLKNMGIALFVYTAVIFIMSILAGTVIPHPSGWEVQINISWSSIMFGLLLFSLGEIFEFGLSLQSDSESIV